MSRKTRIKLNRLNLIAALFLCSIFGFSAIGQDNPLNAGQPANLIAGLKDTLQENLAVIGTSEKKYKAITQKWDARRDPAGKSKRQVIDLLYQDVRAEITNSEMQSQIARFFSFYKQMPDSRFSGKNSFTDPRDGEVYGIKRLGNLTWMKENLRFDIPDASWCYDNDEENCAELGRLYTFEAALESCPAGWRLPEDNDWLDLEKALGLPPNQWLVDGYNIARGSSEGQKLKTGGSSGLEFKISGYASVGNGEPQFAGIDDNRPRSYFWTATSRTVNGQTIAYRRRIEAKNGSIFRFRNPTKGYAVSVRCVQ
jgi:uncharacterized protein (TIGR02145 family)